MIRIATFEKVSDEEFKKRLYETFNYKECFMNDEDFEMALHKIKIPERATKGSAGYDFRSPISFNLNPGESIVIPTGIRVKIDEGWVLMLAPRSSYGFKYRCQLDNTVGIIDSDYYYANNEGHIMIKLTNDSKDPSNRLFVREGDKFVQGIFVPFGITLHDSVDVERTGGIGSTGE